MSDFERFEVSVRPALTNEEALIELPS